MPITINKSPPTKAKAMEVCTARRTRCASCAPKNWEIITVAPEESPPKKPTSRLMMVAVEPPTAARACFPAILPTMTASAVL